MSRIFILMLSLMLPALIKAQTNTFPTSGNAGIGTTTPAGPLDVYGGFYSRGYKFMDQVSPNSSVGFFNPIALALRQGKKLFTDEEFAKGLNNIAIYDNNSTGQVTISRINTLSNIPNSSGYALEIKHSGTSMTPGLGGFYQLFTSGINKTFVQMFRAKIPLGYQLNLHSNPVGTQGGSYWLSNNAGTGKWEWYVRIIQCGNDGLFSTTGHFNITGNPLPTSGAPLIWHIASCTVFDITNVNNAQENYVMNQNVSDQNSSFRISGNGIVGGNVLIGKTTQANPNYKLDVNGNIRSNKIVVNTTGADFVFDPGYQLPSLDSLSTYIQKYRHLPDIPSATEMQRDGLNVGDNQIRLLQKIEELTLFIIEQNKRIEKLEVENENKK